MRTNPDFKKAISQLSSTEKDKLILRLLRYDPILTKRLFFELLENKSVEEKRQEMVELIKRKALDMQSTYYSPGYLLMDMRYLSGDITQHVKITKDKYGEAALNLLMINEVLRLLGNKISQASAKHIYTLGVYVATRIFKILTIIKTLHEDFLIDFEDDLKTLGNAIKGVPSLQKLILSNGLQLSWLVDAEIPSDIAQIHKDVKAKGLLK